MIYKEKPENFNPKLEAVGCFIERDGKILLLHRQPWRPEGNTWGLPAGKVYKGEEITDAIVREIKEETGLTMSKNDVTFLWRLYIKYPTYDSIFNVFKTSTNEKHIVINNEEHQNFKWVSPTEALGMPLIGDLDEGIKLFLLN